MSVIVELKGLTKSFNRVVANSGINLKVEKGTIHAIIGENGAGKSTAMKLLYGMFQPDQGEIWINGLLWGGKQRPWSSPADAIECGIGMVHQHFMLGDPYTVLDNILVGKERSLKGWNFLPPLFRPIDRTGIRKQLSAVIREHGFHVDLDATVEGLPVGVQQRIEIVKLLFRDAKILILDEPTAVLTPGETADLFIHLRRLAEQGRTILIITHKLKEVMSVADEVTVFRMGQVVGQKKVKDTHPEELAGWMVGRKVNLQSTPPPDPVLKDPVLEICDVNLSTRRKLESLNLTIREGEVVGISGVEGNGQSELLQLLTHPSEFAHQMTGSIRICGKATSKMSAHDVKHLGTGIIPEDRHREGLLLDRPVRENFLLGLQRRTGLRKMGLIAQQKLEEATQEALDTYDIRPRSSQISSIHLSGGNQQKLVVAREFKFCPKLIIAAQPTRGVDVGAIEFIHAKILKARATGSGVLLISSELDEILALSDRILVMFEGKFVAEYLRGQVTEQELGLKMGGAVL